jgi:hypothetical protein
LSTGAFGFKSGPLTLEGPLAFEKASLFFDLTQRGDGDRNLIRL